MVPTVRPVPGQSDEEFFEDVIAGRATGGRYKPDELAEYRRRRKVGTKQEAK